MRPGHEQARLPLNAEVGQKKRLAEFRQRRDNETATRCLKNLDTAARSTDNLMPKILDAVRARCTLGEISDALRTVFGEHQEISV